jgi:1-acyl-sn-glycerol-3-phosphate acyltransferase
MVGLPRLTLARRLFRLFARGLTKLLTFALLRARVTGLENFPKQGPALIVFNHLGDTDAVLMLATFPFHPIEGIGKIELNAHWLVGPVFRLYGFIWVHRGRPDRRALRAALDALAEGRMVSIAPEGRQSVTGGLEEANHGAAFLALKSGAPIVPVAMTGTENLNIYGHLKRWRRASVTLTVGKPFVLFPPDGQSGTAALGRSGGRNTLQQGTLQIMQRLAGLLPESYRGNYKSDLGEGSQVI